VSHHLHRPGNKAAALSKKEVDALTAKTNWTAEDLKALHVDFQKHDADGRSVFFFLRRSSISFF
jgi:hypothetical protein